MLTIKIFLASSEELKHERLVIAEQVANMNRTLANQDITLRLVKWEYLDSSMGSQHKQEDYNDYLVDCDMCFALFWTRFGMYTEIEFEKSLKELNSKRNIRHLSVLFKESTTKSEELRAFENKCNTEYPTICHTFKDDDTLKELFNAEVERYISENVRIDKEKDDDKETKSSIQTVRIFLSIDKTLEQERLELTDLVENLNHSLESRNANILMLAWDNSANDNNSFNEEMSKTDLCLNLYYTNFNNATQAELEFAYQALCEGKNPKKIYVYFKDGDTVPEKIQEFRDSFPTKYGHFYCSFSNIDTLKADFLLQFMEYQSKNLGGSKILDVNNGKVTLDGKEYVDLKNVPFAGNNEEYNLLLKSIKKTKKLLAITDEDDEEYADYAAELQELNEKLSKMENSLWDTALMITRLSTTKCSERLKRAMDLFTAGDNRGAQAVLNEEEIERDVEHNLHLIQLGEEGKKGLKINIEEYRLKIKVLINDYYNVYYSTTTEEITELFKKVLSISDKIIDDIEYAEMIYDFINFCQVTYQDGFIEDYVPIAIQFYNEHILSDPSLSFHRLTVLYFRSVLCDVFKRKGKYAEAEKELKQILNEQILLRSDWEETSESEMMEPEICQTHYSLGEVYIKTGILNEAISHFEEAMYISENTTNITIGYKVSLWAKISVALYDIAKYDIGLDIAQKAITIFDTFIGKIPETNLHDLLICSDKYAIHLFEIDQLQESKELFKKSMAIREKIVSLGIVKEKEKIITDGQRNLSIVEKYLS